MWKRKWVDRLSARNTPRVRRRQRPHVEQMEDRRLLSVNVETGQYTGRTWTSGTITDLGDSVQLSAYGNGPGADHVALIDFVAPMTGDAYVAFLPQVANGGGIDKVALQIGVDGERVVLSLTSVTDDTLSVLCEQEGVSAPVFVNEDVTITDGQPHRFAVDVAENEFSIYFDDQLVATYNGSLPSEPMVQVSIRGDLHYTEAVVTETGGLFDEYEHGAAAEANVTVESVDISADALDELFAILTEDMDDIPLVAVASVTAVSAYLDVAQTAPDWSALGSVETTSMHERLARGISASNFIVRHGEDYYDEDCHVDVRAGSGRFLAEYDNGAVVVYTLPDGMVSPQHPVVGEVAEITRGNPDVGAVAKEVSRTGLTYFDVPRGIDVHAPNGYYWIVYVDGTVSQRSLPEGGYVPRPEDFAFGGSDDSNSKSHYGPSMQELGIVDDFNNPKPSSELTYIGDRYISSDGKLRVARQGSIFVQDPETLTILLRPKADAAVAIANPNPQTTKVASHDPGVVSTLFQEAYGRLPTEKELEYWRLRTDKNEAELLGAMQWSNHREAMTTDYGPQDEVNLVISSDDEGRSVMDVEAVTIDLMDGGRLAMLMPVDYGLWPEAMRDSYDAFQPFSGNVYDHLVSPVVELKLSSTQEADNPFVFLDQVDPLTDREEELLVGVAAEIVEYSGGPGAVIQGAYLYGEVAHSWRQDGGAAGTATLTGGVVSLAMSGGMSYGIGVACGLTGVGAPFCLGITLFATGGFTYFTHDDFAVAESHLQGIFENAWNLSELGGGGGGSW